MSHTPAPWVDTYGNDPILILDKKDTNPVALVPFHPRGEHTANAQLIAAAPELLEACKRAEPFLRALRDHLKESEPDYDGRLYEDGALTQLQAVINKAEGK